MFTVQPAPAHLPSLNGAPDRDRAIVATLLYYDLFAFPLRADELARFAHRGGSDGHFSASDLPQQSPWWSSREEYWFLRGREKLVAHRTKLTAASSDKLTRARRYSRILQLIPGVRFIGVTGSLAMQSAVPEDDIDFLIISAPGQLWLTRALVLATLWALGVKRADDGRAEHPNRVCANIFLREDDLRIPDHNLFIAHEICQMLPLIGPAAYRSFIRANAWATEYLPQWEPPSVVWEDHPALRRVQRTFEWTLNGRIGQTVDRELMRRQLERIKHKHSRGHNVGVKVSETQLRFHARDLSDYIVNTFNAHWRALNQPSTCEPVH